MKTLNVMLSNLGGRVVPIGYEGENLYTRIRINCIEVFSEYPDATVTMVVSPPDGEMYPAVVEKSGVMVIWDITDSVLSSNGSGECQLTFTEGDVVRKSVVFGISINRSLVASGEAPEPVQEWIDSDLTDDAGAGSEWYIIALSNRGDYDFSNYRRALNNYLSKNEVGSASSRLKCALTYIAIGDKTNPYVNKALGNSVGEQGIMSLVFGLHLLNNGCECESYSVNGLIDELLSLQLPDGGFSVMGEYGDVDVTAMTVQALGVHYNNPSVKSAVDDALDFLSSRQLENGGYSSYGVANPESSAQVIIMLSSLKIDICTDERFIKNGNTVFEGISKFCLDDGSFCHKAGGASDATATAQVLSASIAYENYKNGKAAFYIFNENKNIFEKTTDVITENSTLTESTSTIETAVLNRSMR